MLTATKVAENFTSYTATEEALYVFTGSVDGGDYGPGYDVVVGGTATVLYNGHESAGTVALIWAKSGETITTEKERYPMLVKINFSRKPKIKQTWVSSSISQTGKKNKIYIGAAVCWSHLAPSSLTYSFNCTGEKTTIAHSNPGWSRNAMSLMIPSEDSAITVTVDENYGEKQGYLFQLEEGNCYIKKSGEWKNGSTYIKKNGSWVSGDVYSKHTTWKN